MTNFASLPSLFTRLLWAVSLLLATAGVARAQVFTVATIDGVAATSTAQRGQTITIAGVNSTNATPLSVAFSGITVTGDASSTILSSNATNTEVTTVVPNSLPDGNYSVYVVLAAGGISTAGTPGLLAISGGPLPVQLVAFTAEAAGNSAYLRWNTASEKNNERFDIESSVDGSTFTRVGSVAGHGSSIMPQQYAFTDENLARYAASLVYYRLRQVDFDGTTSFSPVRTVAAKAGKTVVVLYPTVALDGQATHYAYAGPALPTGATLEVYDATGHRVLAQPMSEVAGTLQTQSLASGWYWVRLAGAAPSRFYRP